jgi:hypothetical protein
MPREPKLDMLPDKEMKLSGEHFRKVVRRIESIVPIAGDGITVEPVDGGHKIGINKDEQFIGGFGVCGFAYLGYDQLFDVIKLNVCSNGSPDTLYVYAPKGQNAEAMLCEI